MKSSSFPVVRRRCRVQSTQLTVALFICCGGTTAARYANRASLLLPRTAGWSQYWM